MKKRKLVRDFILGPAMGKALPLFRGQVLRVQQVGDGQCLDFNAFNLHDYKERFCCGNTRRMHGIGPTVGHHLWSASPRDRVMLTIIKDTVGTNDTNFCRCSAFLYEYFAGFSGRPAHSNCHDIFAEAIREYDLTADDVHDSFNGFMHTGVTPDGRLYIDRSVAKKGDQIEFLAQMDTLVVPVTCGADLQMVSNYEIKPLRIQVFDGSDADHRKLFPPTKRYAHQRTVAEFRVKKIKSSRELRPNPNYTPEWPWEDRVNKRVSIEVTLSGEEARRVNSMVRKGIFGKSPAEVLRWGFLEWWGGSGPGATARQKRG
ncbi:MAG: DUF1989 domain-containing protein [Nitrospinota bacterium]